MGIEILPPDINASQAKFSNEQGKIRFALGALKNVSVNTVQTIVETRTSHGPFADIFSFLDRCSSSVNKKILESLIKSGAIDSIYPNRCELLNNCDILLKCTSKHAKSQTSQMQLFALDEELDTTRPKLATYDEWDFQNKLGAEFEAFGFYLSKHPLEAYNHKLKKLHLTESCDVEARATLKGAKLTVAGVITSKKVRSSKRGKYAFMQLSDRSGLLEFSIFKEELLYKHENILNVGSLVHLKIEARKDDSGYRVAAEEIHDLAYSLSHIQTSLEITITNTNAIPQLKECLTSSGKIVRLRLKLPEGEEVIFGSRKQMFICPAGEEKIRKIAGLSIFESAS
jgi:DNA polymerase-3 subunit alpha